MACTTAPKSSTAREIKWLVSTVHYGYDRAFKEYQSILVNLFIAEWFNSFTFSSVTTGHVHL